MSTKIETQHFVIPITENVQEELKKLIDAGWTPIPGAAPLAIWHMQRLAPAEQTAGMGPTIGMTVKDEGVTIIRGSGGDASKMN